jgi:hypothetical protein
VHGFGQKYHKHGNQFGCTRLNSKVTWVMWNLVLVHLEIVLVLVQERCTVCDKCTIGIKTILDTPKGTPRFEAQVEALFNPFGDSVNLDTR